MLDFYETIRVPQNFQLGNSVEVHARSAVCAASQIICITIENSIFKDFINIKVTFDLDFDLGSHK